MISKTMELYGVDPADLAEMKYGDALQALRVGLINRKKELADKLFLCREYKEASAIQSDIRKVMKAMDINDLRIEEINGN